MYVCIFFVILLQVFDACDAVEGGVVLFIDEVKRCMYAKSYVRAGHACDMLSC